jgi:hypothetical protein
MNRRTFNQLAGLAALGLAGKGRAEAAPPAQAEANNAGAVRAGDIVLEDSELLAAFDPVSGALTRIERKSSHWVVQRNPELGISFRLLVPMAGRRANYVLGQKQRAASIEKVSGTELRVQWKDLASEHAGVVPITFSASVTLKNGILNFDASLENDSDLWVETVDYPYLGDLKSPAEDAVMRAEHVWYGHLDGTEIHPHFTNDKGYWGVDVPTKTIDSWQGQICLLQTQNQGMYVGVHDTAIRYLVQFTFEQHPGVVTAIDSDVPAGNQISGLPVHLEFRLCHFVFVRPHSSVKFVPIVMRAYDGDWHAGLDVYKEWRATWFTDGKLPDWAKDIHSWLQLQVDGAEQDFSIPYRKIAEYGRECAENGVSAIQLVGWNRGGQDGGDPSLDTDPGLGTWDELHDAIAQVQAGGVKMILFGKLYFADLTTEWYKKELYKYQTTDPFGIPYQAGGFSYTTPTQLAGINNRRRAIMDVLCPAYRDAATKEFEKTVALGASGWLFDEVCHHSSAGMTFSAGHGYEPPGYIYGGDMPLARQFHAACDAAHPDFLFAGEAPQDWLLQYYPFSYFRIGADTRHSGRYIDPQRPLMVAVTGFDDREMLNLILAYRYVISYEPYNFKGHVTDFPLTLAYGKKIDALRRKYRTYLWDAEFRDTQGASVEARGAHRYTVFHAAGGKRAVVVVNEQSNGEITATVELPNSGRLVLATPEEPEAKHISGTLKIPARSAAVVMEV